jgi:hypothetical protein
MECVLFTKLKEVKNFRQIIKLIHMYKWINSNSELNILKLHVTYKINKEILLTFTFYFTAFWGLCGETNLQDFEPYSTTPPRTKKAWTEHTTPTLLQLYNTYIKVTECSSCAFHITTNLFHLRFMQIDTSRHEHLLLWLCATYIWSK